MRRLRLSINSLLYRISTVFTVCMIVPVFEAGANEREPAAGVAELSSPVLHAAGDGSNTIGASYLAQLVVGLLIVLMCIVALAWLARRFNRLQSTPDGALKVLGGMSMGARERIVLVQVGAKQLLIGVAPGHINTLHVLDEPLESGATGGDVSQVRNFAEKLNAVIARNSNR